MAILAGDAVCVVAQDPPAAEADGQGEPVREPSPLLHEPQSPEELFSATRLMVDLARLDLADRYLAQLLKGDLSDETLIALRDKHGTADFVKLTRIPELKVNASELLDRLNGASRRQAVSPEYVDRLVSQLEQGEEQRELALRSLRSMGVAAVPRLIHHLVISESAEHTDQIIHALTRMGLPAIPALTAALDASDNAVRLAVLKALSDIHGRAAVPFLWHPAFYEQEPTGIRKSARDTLNRILSDSGRPLERITATAAADELRKIARELFYRQYEMPREEDGTVAVWSWNDEVQTVVARGLLPEEANLWLAVRFARQAYDLSPDQPETQRLYLASLLGWTVAEAGRERPIPVDPGTPGYVALTAGYRVMSEVLSEALAAGQAGSAQAAIQILKQIGSPQEIFAGSGRKAPLLAALNYPDVRVQFAAADAVLRSDPRHTFPGASRVLEILTQAISSSEEAKALIVDADRRRAEITAGYLANLGYVPVTVRTGKDGFVKASTVAGINLIVLDVNCIQWDLSQTMANLRADARTAYVPIVLYGPEDVADIQTREGRRNAMAFPEAASPIWKGTLPPGGRKEPVDSRTRRGVARLLAYSQPATFVAESGTAADFDLQIRPFLAAIRGATLSDPEREERKMAAVEWLAHLAASENQAVFPLQSAEAGLSGLVDDPALVSKVLQTLGAIESATAQRRLMEITVNQRLDAPLRANSARYLAHHIQRYGVLLKEEQLRQLAAVWKSETDPTVSTELAAVMGTLEPDQAALRERLNTLRPAR